MGPAAKYGKLWREVSEAEMDDHMSHEVRDRFSKVEVEELVYGIFEPLVQSGHFLKHQAEEYTEATRERPPRTPLPHGPHNRYWLSRVDTLRVHTWDYYEENPWVSRLPSDLGAWIKEYKPRTFANLVEATSYWTGTPPGETTKRVVWSFSKSDEDWFYITRKGPYPPIPGQTRHYLCDGIRGALDCLGRQSREIVEWAERQPGGRPPVR